MTYGVSIGNRQEIRAGSIMKAAQILGLIHVLVAAQKPPKALNSMCGKISFTVWKINELNW